MIQEIKLNKQETKSIISLLELLPYKDSAPIITMLVEKWQNNMHMTIAKVKEE